MIPRATTQQSLLAALLAVIPFADVHAQEPNFGRAVAMTTTELVIGQPVNWYAPGNVYTYRMNGAGRWVERQRISAPAPDGQRMDDFGRTLALQGNTLLVAAPRMKGDSGIVYIFSRSSTNVAWRGSGRISAPAGGQFGAAMALSGDDVFIGAPQADSSGAVYHYRRSGTEWQLQSTLHVAASTASQFGASLSVQGDRLLIGAPATDSGSGRVFASRRVAGAWSTPQALSVTGSPRAALGSSVLLDGARAFAGAPGANTVHMLSSEAGDRWVAAGHLSPYDGNRGRMFGAALAKVGTDLWVGAPAQNGRVYRFLDDRAKGWGGAMALVADSSEGSSWPFSFGYAIASAGTRAVVSMPTRDFGEGRALALSRRATAWTTTQVLQGRIATITERSTPAASCTNGKIDVYTCNNVDLVAHMPISALGGERGVWLNDIWGWTDPQTQRDYALVARRDGASFVDVTDPWNPKLVGTMSRTRGSPPSVWRDIKVIGNHAYVVADGAGAHGVQVFDLTRLRSARNAPEFEPDTTYHGIASAHNIVADTSSRYLYVVGANSGGETCGGGLHIIDARQSESLKFIGCYNDVAGANPRGYTHDAQCVTYNGPDARYRGREICVGSNEKEINVADVTDKSKPVVIGRNSYPNVSYAHQGWFDQEQRFFYMNDEGDEAAGLVEGTRTIVWDLTDLSDPVVAHMYVGPVKSSDHNLYVVGNRVYESNYGSGLRVLDITDRKTPKEIGYFDSAPFNNDEPGFSAAVSGAWSNYPFFKSGVVIFTSVREGLFIVRVRDLVP